MPAGRRGPNRRGLFFLTFLVDAPGLEPGTSSAPAKTRNWLSTNSSWSGRKTAIVSGPKVSPSREDCGLRMRGGFSAQ